MHRAWNARELASSGTQVIHLALLGLDKGKNRASSQPSVLNYPQNMPSGTRLTRHAAQRERDDAECARNLEQRAAAADKEFEKARFG